jgi:hypothetical protein
MNMGEWLRGLGLGQYESAFRDNGMRSSDLIDVRSRKDRRAVTGGLTRKTASSPKHPEALP